MIPGEPFCQQERKRHAMTSPYLAWVSPQLSIQGYRPRCSTYSPFHPSPEVHVIDRYSAKHGYPSVVTKLEGVSQSKKSRKSTIMSNNPLGIKLTMENGHYGPIWYYSKKIFNTEEESNAKYQSVCARHGQTMTVAHVMNPYALVHASKMGERHTCHVRCICHKHLEYLWFPCYSGTKKLL